MGVSLEGLGLTGSDEEPRWLIRITSRDACYGGRDWGRDCCTEGHLTPEEAAAHGAALAVTILSGEARRSPAGSAGATALAKVAA